MFRMFQNATTRPQKYRTSVKYNLISIKNFETLNLTPLIDKTTPVTITV